MSLNLQGHQVLQQNDASVKVLPLFDASVLERLREELGEDDSVWRVFVQNFIALLPDRIRRIQLALTTGDLAGALDAALSLKTSAQMVGAERLAGLAFELELSLRAVDDQEPERVLPHMAAVHLQRITRISRQTTDLLLRCLA
jgi:HPt (histidine-containing phosphotransfer) domain-containing protein